MHARVATFKHDNAEAVDKMLEEIRRDSESGPPPGLEMAKGFILLADRENAKSVGIIFFEDEEALKRGAKYSTTCRLGTRPVPRGLRSSFTTFRFSS